MAEAEWKAPLTRLEEVALVQAGIMDRLEKKYDAEIQRHDEAVREHDEEIADLRKALLLLSSALERTNSAVEKTHTEVQLMNSSMSGLLERMDKFIRGQESNGRKN